MEREAIKYSWENSAKPEVDFELNWGVCIKCVKGILNYPLPNTNKQW